MNMEQPQPLQPLPSAPEPEPQADGKILRASAGVVSFIFSPLFMPLVAFVALFFCTYLRIMPDPYRRVVLGIVACFTIMLPVITVFLFRKISDSTPGAAGAYAKRLMPYLLSIISFIFCSLMMYRLHTPWYMNGIIIASIVVMVVFMLLGLWWNVSLHTGAMGAVIGGIVSFAGVFVYDPVPLLCVAILLTGVVGTARIIVGHTLSDVLSGFSFGLLCSLVVLHPSSSIMNRIFSMF